MLTCILLNQTHGRQVRPMLDRLWELLPNPAAVMHLSSEDGDRLRDLLRPLGFMNRRAVAIYRMTSDYLRGVPYHECYGMGKYGRDAIEIFVNGSTDVQPTDRWLQPYLEWRKAGGPPVEWREGCTMTS
jgi:hypothetical protein